MCDSVKGGAQCKETANSFAGMTAMFGKSFHDNGMREACDCVSEEEAPARFNEYVKFIYTEYNKDGLTAVPSVGACSPIEEKACTADQRIEALVQKHSVDKSGKKKHPGKLFWKLVNTYLLRNASPKNAVCGYFCKEECKTSNANLDQYTARRALHSARVWGIGSAPQSGFPKLGRRVHIAWAETRAGHRVRRRTS